MLRSAFEKVLLNFAQRATLRLVSAALKKQFFGKEELPDSRDFDACDVQLELSPWASINAHGWSGLTIGPDLQRIVRQILTEFADDPEAAEADLIELFEELREAGLFNPTIS